jgi:sec-independent protein translocase protein TatA
MPSGSELLVIMVAVLVLFGGKKIPDIARTAGKIFGDLQKATRDFKKELDVELRDRDNDDRPIYKG